MFRSTDSPARLLPIVTLGAILLTAQSCRTPVYSPALGMSARPISKNEGQLSAGVALLAETQVQPFDSRTTEGMFASLRYGFSSRLNVQVKFAQDVHENRNCTSVGGLYNLSTDTLERWSLHSEFGMATTGNQIDGWGISGRAVYAHYAHEDIALYAAVGGLFGFHDIRRLSENTWGIALLLNGGVSWRFARNWDMNAELPLAIQYSRYDQSTYLVPAPAVGITWRFENW